MFRIRGSGALVVVAAIGGLLVGQVSAETLHVRLCVREKKADEKTITRANLIRIKRFVLRQGKRETYCNMYNNNPAYQTREYQFYLNPDSGQENSNCDPRKSDFHNLTIRRLGGGRDQYRTVEFLDKHDLFITTNWPSDDLTVRQMCGFVEDALEEILVEIRRKSGVGSGDSPGQIRDGD